jgi:hypothetical protein
MRECCLECLRLRLEESWCVVCGELYDIEVIE